MGALGCGGFAHVILMRCSFNDLHNLPPPKKGPGPCYVFETHLFVDCLHPTDKDAGVATVCAEDDKPFTLSGCEPIPCETPADMLDKYALPLGPKSSVSKFGSPLR